MNIALADRQAAFLRAILDETARLPNGWGDREVVGMEIYRGNYRSSLMSALEAAYERTRRYVGEEPFRRAGAHHLIAHPPTGWTIDAAGEGFAATCAELFAANPEVAELAWLEWTMQQAATAPDTAPLSAAGFAAATVGFDDARWLALRVGFQPRAAARVTDFDLKGLWNALTQKGQDIAPALLSQPMGCIVWREGEQPAFLMVEPDNARAFAALRAGATYGDVIALLAGADAGDAALQAAAVRAGQMLGMWLGEGIIAGLT